MGSRSLSLSLSRLLSLHCSPFLTPPLPSLSSSVSSWSSSSSASLFLAPRHPHPPSLPLAVAVASIVTRTRARERSYTRTESLSLFLAVAPPAFRLRPSLRRFLVTRRRPLPPRRGPRVETLPLCASLLLFVSPRRPPSARGGGGRPSLASTFIPVFLVSSLLLLARPSVQEKRVRRRDPWLRPPLYPLINIRRHDQPVHRRRVPLIGCGYTATSPRYAEPTSSFRGIAKWNWTDRPFKGSSSVVMGLRRLCEDGLWPGEGRRSGFEGGIIDFWVDRCNGSVFGNIEWGGRGRDVSFRKFGVFVENAIWQALVYLS